MPGITSRSISEPPCLMPACLSTPGCQKVHLAQIELCQTDLLTRALRRYECKLHEGHFRAQVYLHKTIADLLPYGFIWTPFCPDLDQVIFAPKYTFPSHSRFASIWLHLDTFLSRSGSNHFRAQVHPPKAMADLLPYGFIWTLEVLIHYQSSS